ncbi:MAG: hypothetical protein ACP5N1_03130 [Candidatus Woesearchaeota archaeon]
MGETFFRSKSDNVNVDKPISLLRNRYENRDLISPFRIISFNTINAYNNTLFRTSAFEDALLDGCIAKNPNKKTVLELKVTDSAEYHSGTVFKEIIPLSESDAKYVTELFSSAKAHSLKAFRKCSLFFGPPSSFPPNRVNKHMQAIYENDFAPILENLEKNNDYDTKLFWFGGSCVEMLNYEQKNEEKHIIFTPKKDVPKKPYEVSVISQYLGTNDNRDSKAWLFVGQKNDNTLLVKSGGLDTNMAIRNLEGLMNGCEREGIEPLRLYEGFGLFSAMYLEKDYFKGDANQVEKKIKKLDAVSSDYHGQINNLDR